MIGVSSDPTGSYLSNRNIHVSVTLRNKWLLLHNNYYALEQANSF